MTSGTRIRGANSAETYTARTQGTFPAYALRRKSLSHLVGLGRVELPTSRLSGPPLEIGRAQDRSEPRGIPASRHVRGEKARGDFLTRAAYTARTRENGTWLARGPDEAYDEPAPVVPEPVDPDTLPLFEEPTGSEPSEPVALPASDASERTAR